MANQPLVAVVMGSQSDWQTMSLATEQLTALNIPYHAQVVSAHRTPELMFEYAKTAQERGLKILIAGAGGAAHLPGMLASLTLLPVLGVPVKSKALSGVDSLLSINQMPAGVPVGTLAIGEAGATNAALLAVRMLAVENADLSQRLDVYQQTNRQKVMSDSVISDAEQELIG